MARFGVVVDINQLPGESAMGASVAVKLPGKNANAGTLYADSTSAATLANPFTVPAGQKTVEFWMAQNQAVDVTVTPASGSAVTLPNTQVSMTTPQHQTLTAFGKVVKWFLS